MYHNADRRRTIGKITAAMPGIDGDRIKHSHTPPTMREKAIAYHDSVAPYLDEIRDHIDDLELMVDNQMWPLPKYRELLFIR